MPIIFSRNQPARGINPLKRSLSTETTVKTVGDVSLRVNDLPPMKRFYLDVLGFELLGDLPSVALLKRSDNHRGQIQMLALLQRSVGVRSEPGVVRHITFILSIPDPESERRRLEGLGLCVGTTSRETTGKCSLCFHDPEGNEVELLCPDPTPDRRRNPRFCKLTHDRSLDPAAQKP